MRDNVIALFLRFLLSLHCNSASCNTEASYASDVTASHVYRTYQTPSKSRTTFIHQKPVVSDNELIIMHVK